MAQRKCNGCEKIVDFSSTSSLCDWCVRNTLAQDFRIQPTTKTYRELFAKNPYCVYCKRQGKLVMATIRDHKIPLWRGGLEEESNTQGLCYLCHKKKNRLEARQRNRMKHGLPPLW